MIQKYFRNLKETTKTITCSLDMHESSTWILIVDTSTGEILEDSNCYGSVKKVLKRLLKYKGLKDSMEIVYEAGGLGYYPYRLFTKHGFTCSVIAPHSLPKRNRQKNDRLDSADNLSDHLSGGLKYVYIPTEEDVQAREILRERGCCIHKRTKEKQSVTSLVKRSGLHYEKTKTSWTKTHIKWLKTVKVNTAVRQIINIKLSLIATYTHTIDVLDKSLHTLFQTHSVYRKHYALYRFLPGVGPINAMTFTLEALDMNRFTHPKQVMSYSGVVPNCHQSGTFNPSCPITKTGNKYFRLSLINAAGIYNDARRIRPINGFTKLSKPAKHFFNKIRTRLLARYHHLRQTGKVANKAKTAVARELCGFLWELMVKVSKTLTEKDWEIFYKGAHI